MTNYFWKALALVTLALAVFVVVELFVVKNAAAAGAVGLKLIENYDPYVRYNNGIATQLPFSLGLNGTSINRINTGFCFFAPSGTTVAASTTVAIDCQNTATVGANGESALTGVTTGDKVVLTAATSTGSSTYLGTDVTGCSASSTPGFITCNFSNGTGGTFTWPTTGTASGTASYIVTN